MTGTDAPAVPEPRANPDLVGHEAAERTLLRAWTSGRLPHAWLIAGPRGIGKATLAFRFARFVLAGGGGLFGAADDLFVEPADPVARRVASGGHADLRTLQRTFNEKRDRLRSEIVIDDVREVGAFLRLTPAEGGWRVVVVDNADELNRNAANALLKVLEEPPARALLLLVSHAPGRLLPTIRSRCQRLALAALPEATVAGLLARYRPDLDAVDAAALARLAEGSIGRAVELGAAGGLDLYRAVAGLMLGLPRLDSATLHGLGDRFNRPDGEVAFRTAAGLLGRWLGRMVHAGAAGAAPSEVLPGEADCMRRLLAARGLDQWLELWDKIGRLFARTESVSLDRKQVWVTAFLEIEVLARP